MNPIASFPSTFSNGIRLNLLAPTRKLPTVLDSTSSAPHAPTQMRIGLDHVRVRSAHPLSVLPQTLRSLLRLLLSTEVSAHPFATFPSFLSFHPIVQALCDRPFDPPPKPSFIQLVLHLYSVSLSSLCIGGLPVSDFFQVLGIRSSNQTLPLRPNHPLFPYQLRFKYTISCASRQHLHKYAGAPGP